MAPTALLSKTSVRTAGVLTLSGLMVGGVVLSQGADAAPETQAVSSVTPVAALHSADAQIDYVPAGLARPAVAPKSHQQIAAEKKAADDAAQAKADAQKQAEEAQKRADEAQQKQQQAQQKEQQRQQQEAQDAKAASAEKDASEATASAQKPAAQQTTAAQATTSTTQTSSGSAAVSGTKSSGTAQHTASTKTQSSGSYDRDAVVAAARGQIGVHQDCTALVTNSLRAAGINFHGWPKDYLSLGHTVSSSEAQPGDIIYYASNGFGGSHVAIYLGNGQAIHGGWEGGTTAQFSAYLPSASSPVFIHVDR